MVPLSGHLARFGRVCLCSFGLLWAATAQPQALSPEVSRGLSWLQNQVQLDGTLANEGTSIATALQNRAEVAQTFKTLSALPANLTDVIASETEDNTEYLARRIVSLTLAGRDASALVTVLSARQNPDGGFGGGPGYDSNALDTAWALIAFKSANAIAPLSPALGYLASAQASDGSYSAPVRPDVETTAIVVFALRAYASQFGTIAEIQRAVPYLLSQQSPAQQWSDSPFLTATAYEAIHDFVPLEPTASAVRTYLISRQAAEGNWENGDPFSTALALRALRLSGTAPANPTLAIVRGKVVDGQTGFALDGVTAALTGPANPTPRTTSAGLFEFRDLPGGAYNLQLSLSQYGAITTTTQISAGQTLELGVLQMSKVQGATTGTVRGTVRDSATNQPVGNVLVATNGGLSALTDGTGNYQIVNVPPGTITVQASKSGYANAAASGSIATGGVLLFSPVLVPSDQSGAGATITGTVIRASDNVPLAGVLVTVSGATTAGATTDAVGRYSICDLNAGSILVSASLTGFDTVTASANVMANATVNFSPRLFATGSAPPNANTAGVTGVVLDAGDNTPLAGVTVLASIPGSPNRSVQSGPDGIFGFGGISASSVGLQLTLGGYVGAVFDVPLDPLTTLDLGQVRLRKSQAQQLLPDLTVTAVSRSGATTHPQTLTVTGSVSATIANVGTAASAAGVDVLAFFDVNRNGAFDEGTDSVLGRATLTAALNTGASAVLQIPVGGQLPFRDAPIHVWVDSLQAVAELNEGNNVRSTAQAFEIKPAIGTVLPVAKWEWTGSPVMPTYFRVMMTPVVAPLYDTNSDGKIDSNDAPAIAFVAYEQRDGDFRPGTLRVIDGRDGSDILAVSDLNFKLGSYSNLAIGDLDGDGIPEIVGVLFSGGLVAFNRDGSVKWANTDPSMAVGWTFGGPSIADLDGDGKAEVIYGKTVVNHDGTTRWVGSGGFVGSNHIFGIDMFSAVADINLDGQPHLIAGGSAFDRSGALVWQNNAVGNGLVGLGNFNSDPYPEIVVVSAGRVFLLDRFGQIIWGPVALPGGGRGGPPTIADVDGDGIPEIGVAGLSRYSVFRADGSLLWSVPSQDTSQVTGSTVFDFDGDGKAEVIYNDEKLLRVFNGATGQVIFSVVNPSGTGSEYPVVVDLDGDGHADLLAVRNDFFETSPSGIRAFRDANNSWVSARGIWNQHTYHVTNVNDDGSIPRVEQNSWQAHNTYRANIGRRLFSCLPPPAGAPTSALSPLDVSASYLRIQDGGPNPSTFTVRVGNSGGFRMQAGVRTAFYNGAPDAGGALLGSVTTTRVLDPGQFEDVNLVFPGSLATLTELVAVTDDDGRLAECDESNNRVSYLLADLPGVFSVQAATDQPSYVANSNVAITATVADAGSLDRPATVRFTIETGDGMATVTTLEPSATISVPAGVSRTANAVWNTGLTLAGVYRVKAELLDGVGQPYAAAFAPFDITAGGATASTKVSVDKLTYLPSETVRVTSRVENLTENQPLDGLIAITTVTHPDGGVRFTRSESIVQLVQGALKDFNYTLPLAFGASGSYAVTLSVRNALGAVLASSSTGFTVFSSAATGSGLTGSLSGTPKPVPFGDPIAFNAVVNNLGNADIAALNVKITIVDPAEQQVLAEFPATLALARQHTAPLSFGWPASAGVGGTYVAVLTVTVGTATLTLAQEAFVIAPPATRVTGTLAAIPKQVPQGVAVSLSANVNNAGFGAITGLPISVIVANSATQQVLAQFTDSLAIGLQQTIQRTFSWPATGAVGTSYTAALTAMVNGVARTLAQESFGIIAPPVQLDVALTNLKQARVLVLLSCKYGDNDSDGDHDTEQGDPAKQACVTQKSAFFASYLTSLGINYRITITADAFTRAFRSGQYNTYWITGGGMKLDNDLTDEVREAVFRGDALILDAVHDERNHGLDAIAGTNVHGKLRVTGPAINLSGPLFAPGTLGSSGRPLQLDLTTGVAQAVFAASPSRPAIVTNQYGLGRGILFAYNLVATLMTQPSTALNDLVSAAIGWAAPAPATVSEARSYTVLRARVANVGIAADLKATLTPLAGATVLGTAPAATPDASGRPVWTFTLDSGATKNLDVGLRLPVNTGSFTANISIDSARNDLAAPFSKFITLSVESADTVAPRVADELSALAVSSSEKYERDHAVSSIQAGQASMAAGAYEQAIGQLLTAAERLSRITSVGVRAQRVQVGRMLQEAQVRWFLAQPQ